MNIETINSTFLTNYCKATGVSRFGYLKYEYKPYENKNLIAKIRVEEEVYKVKIVQYVGNAIHFEMGNSAEVSNTEYLSREIHKFL